MTSDARTIADIEIRSWASEPVLVTIDDARFDARQGGMMPLYQVTAAPGVGELTVTRGRSPLPFTPPLRVTVSPPAHHLFWELGELEPRRLRVDIDRPAEDAK